MQQSIADIEAAGFTKVDQGTGTIKINAFGQEQEANFEGAYFIDPDGKLGVALAHVQDREPAFFIYSKTADSAILSMPGMQETSMELDGKTIATFTEGKPFSEASAKHAEASAGKEILADEAGIKEILPTIPQMATDYTMQMMAEMMKAMSGAMEGMGEALGEAMGQVGEAMGEALSGAMEGMGDAMGASPEDTDASFDEAAAGLEEAGKTMGEALTSAVEELTTTVAELGQEMQKVQEKEEEEE